jgi:hypothetical protein
VRQAFLCADKFLSSAAKPPYLNKIRRRLWLAPITSKGKAMRKTLGICLLVLLLTGSASAGIMPNLPPAPPPSQQTSAVQEPTDTAQEPLAPGEIPNLAPDSLTQTALDLLAVMSSLL